MGVFNTIGKEGILIPFETRGGYCYIRNIFNIHFNTGFKAPSTEKGSICLKLKEQLKIEKDHDKRHELDFRQQLNKNFKNP